VKNVKANARLYPLSAAENPPKQTFVNVSGVQLNTIHANDFHFYEELNAVVQAEPVDAFDPELIGLFAAIGIKKGQPFAPDASIAGDSPLNHHLSIMGLVAHANNRASVLLWCRATEKCSGAPGQRTL
jgi:hypothetical protein